MTLSEFDQVLTSLCLMYFLLLCSEYSFAVLLSRCFSTLWLLVLSQESVLSLWCLMLCRYHRALERSDVTRRLRITVCSSNSSGWV